MDINKIKAIITLFEDSKLSSLSLEIDDMKIKLEKPCVTTEVVPVITQTVSDKKEKIEDKQYLKSPIVGTFYSAKSETSAPFVSAGTKVHKGDVICIIEAMKVMNEIKADRNGTILEVLVENGEMVQFDQALFVVGD